MAALVSEMTGDRTTVTLVNLNQTAARAIVVQGGAHGEHRLETTQVNGHVHRIGSPSVTIRLAPGAGASLTIAMRRYAEKPTEAFPAAVR